MNTRLSISLAIVGLLLAGVSCRAATPEARKTIQMDKKIEIGQAESTLVSIALGIGQLIVAGGAEGRVDAGFEYDIPDWKPEVTYEVEKGLGRLTVRQPSSKVGATAKTRYEWNIRLPGRVPTDLAIEMGTGKVNLDARGVNLRRLKLAVGIGEGRIDLSSVTANLTAEIEAGVGKLKLLLPSDVGVRARAEGIGNVKATGLAKDIEGWTNDAWGKSKVSIDVTIRGIGEVEIETIARQTI